MINKKEVLIVGLIIIITTLSINISVGIIDDWMIYLGTLGAVSFIILMNILAKKVTAYMLDSEIEMKIWDIKKIGIKKVHYLNKAFPIGAFLPIISKLILFPFKSFVWMASLVFEVRPRTHRSAKRYGIYTFSEMTEYHLGLIAAAGIIINLLVAAIGYFLGFPLLARLSIYYAFFNILPVSELDGNRIFFGNLVLWSILSTLVLIGMLLAIFIV